MPYDAPLAPTTLTVVRSRPQVMHDLRSRTARQAPDGVAPSRADDVHSVEPMLFVYQERVETFRLIAATVRRCLGALVRWFAS